MYGDVPTSILKRAPHPHPGGGADLLMACGTVLARPGPGNTEASQALRAPWAAWESPSPPPCRVCPRSPRRGHPRPPPWERCWPLAGRHPASEAKWRTLAAGGGGMLHTGPWMREGAELASPPRARNAAARPFLSRPVKLRNCWGLGGLWGQIFLALDAGFASHQSVNLADT